MGLKDWFRSSPEGEDPHLLALATQVADLRAQVELSERDLAGAELETSLLGSVAGQLRPGMTLQGAGEVMLELLKDPLELATFFVARVDFEQDLTHFPVFFEGGRLRRHAPTPFSTGKGLTGRALELNEPLYIRDMIPEGIALGALLSRAEEVTGLIAATWYGIPIHGSSAQPAVLVAFQVFPRDGFSESRRAFLQRMAKLLGLAAQAEIP
jgi:hypothetical protein